MAKLELKIPPVLVVVLFVILMWLISLLLPGFHTSAQFRMLACVVLAGIGALFSVSAVLSFRKARTTVNPTAPETCSSLVISGVYKMTRNPMYLGLLFFLLAWGLFLSNLYSLIFSASFVLYMNRFQIQPEERALETCFGAEFLAYKNQVRRWL
jgi:protein-S-isoprenylcysteine O-methyltransferase Ste14